MRKAGIVPLQSMSAQRLRTFVRWINACAVIGMILAAGLGAVGLVGANSVRSDPAAAPGTQPAEYTAAEQRLERSGVFLAYETLF
jgi:hypothetical protein